MKINLVWMPKCAFVGIGKFDVANERQWHIYPIPFVCICIEHKIEPRYKISDEEIVFLLNLKYNLEYKTVAEFVLGLNQREKIAVMKYIVSDYYKLSDNNISKYPKPICLEKLERIHKNVQHKKRHQN